MNTGARLRLLRASFSGELAFEIHCQPEVAPELWTRLGTGVYRFDGDPVEKCVLPEDGIAQQLAEHRELHPGGLVYTHAGLLYHKFGCWETSRMAIAVAGLGGKCTTAMDLHSDLSALSLRDLDAYYRKLCRVLERTEI